jgi:hypothetical protein
MIYTPFLTHISIYAKKRKSSKRFLLSLSLWETTQDSEIIEEMLYLKPKSSYPFPE